MNLRQAFKAAKIIEITWYPEPHNSIQMVISKASANKKIKPMYNDYLGINGDYAGGLGDFDGELLWYGEGGTIIASFFLDSKTLVLGA